MKRLLTVLPLLLALVASAATTNTVDIGAATATRIANATNLASIKVANTNIVGVIPIGNIATGTPDGTKFVRDDGTLAATPAGDVTAAGQNNLSGSNYFSGPVKFTGTVEIENGNADSTVQNLTVNGMFTGAVGGTNIVSEIGDSVIPSTITRDSELSIYATTTQLTAATNNPAQTWDSELLVYQLGNSSLSNLFGRTVVTNGHSVSLTLSNDFTVNGNSTFNGTVTINSPNATSTIPNLVVSTSLEGAGTNALFQGGTNAAFTAASATFLAQSETNTFAAGITNAAWTATQAATNGTVAKATSAVNATNVYGTITASQVSDPENFAWSAVSNNTGVITMGKFNTTNITGDITMGLLSGLSASGWKNGALYITNSTADDHSVTFNATIRLSTNTFVLGQVVWVTNKSDVLVAIGHTAYSGTNAAATRWPKQ